jgi:DNA-binding response OmpR family regulator
MPSAKRSILYVDDDEGARLMLTLHFGQQGFEVTAVSTSQAAQFILPEELFDLYILGLPRTDAATFCRKIRQFHRHAPIIIYSSVTRRFEQDAALWVGYTVSVAKPNINQLLESVMVALDF